MKIRDYHKCEFCANQAIVDSKTIFGPWGFLCKDHYLKYGTQINGLYTPLVDNFDNIIKEDANEYQCQVQ